MHFRNAFVRQIESGICMQEWSSEHGRLKWLEAALFQTDVLVNFELLSSRVILVVSNNLSCRVPSKLATERSWMAIERFQIEISLSLSQSQLDLYALTIHLGTIEWVQDFLSNGRLSSRRYRWTILIEQCSLSIPSNILISIPLNMPLSIQTMFTEHASEHSSEHYEHGEHSQHCPTNDQHTEPSPRIPFSFSLSELEIFGIPRQQFSNAWKCSCSVPCLTIAVTVSLEHFVESISSKSHL